MKSGMAEGGKRILLVQYAGDYREAYRRLQATGTETYYGHRYVLEQLQQLQSYGEVAMMCCLSGERYEERLDNGLTVIGAAAHPKRQSAQIKRQIAAWNPTHLIVLGPLTALIRWGLDSGCRVMCQMADSFNIHPLLRFVKYGRLPALLNDSRVERVANHGANACRSLVRIGVEQDKILAWDWPYSRRPDALPPRVGPPSDPAMLYVGTIQRKKGVGDAIRAVAVLRQCGTNVRLRLAGGGAVEEFRALAQKLGVADLVDFLGVIPNTQVFDLMRDAALVVVPSLHSYPEGLPLTIYEALCARAPIVASDHPMFDGHLVDGQTAAVFRAGDADALAIKVAALLADRGLYARLSECAQQTWERMQNPVKWGDILNHWIADAPVDRQWLHDHRFTAMFPQSPAA